MDALKRWRAGWGYPTCLLCVCGFFSTVKPLEPFLILYLTGPDKNLTLEQVNSEIFPVWTYSYLATLVPVFLLTDWLRYKPVVVLQCASLLATTAMLLWLRGVAAMQAMQFFYGVVTASEVAYFSYIYSVVELSRYRRATAYCRSVQLLGYTAGYALGQALVSLSLLSFHHTLVLTLALTCVALVTSCFLPMPRRSMFFHHSDDGERKDSKEGEDVREGDASAGRGGGEEDSEGGARGRSCRQPLRRLWEDLAQCCSSRQLLYWSAWWTLATCGYNLTVNYVQVLWEHVEPSENFTVYNGAVEATSSLFGAATSYGVGFSQVDWARWGELLLGFSSALGAAALFLMTYAGNIWLCYAAYVVFRCLYVLLITVAMFQIATELSVERYALIFGANTFGALVLQTIVTTVVVDSGGLGLDIITQFVVYASYFSAIGVLFTLRGVYTAATARRSHEDHSHPGQAPSLTDTDTGRAHRL